VIVGLGIDLVEVARIEIAMRNPRFIERVLTPSEREFCLTPAQVAGRWAAKEAIYKAVGLRVTWQQIEVLPDEIGAPRATLDSRDFDPGRLRLRVSITHERNYATAIAIVERVVYQAPHP